MTTTTVVAAGGTYELAATYEEVTRAAATGFIAGTTTCGRRVAIAAATVGVIAEGTTARRQAGFTAEWEET